MDGGKPVTADMPMHKGDSPSQKRAVLRQVPFHNRPVLEHSCVMKGDGFATNYIPELGDYEISMLSGRDFLPFISLWTSHFST